MRPPDLHLASADESRPSWSGKRVVLRQLVESDYGAIFDIEQHPYWNATYRHRGRSIPTYVYSDSLWSTVECQYAVASKSDGRLLGVAALYGTDFRNGVGFFSGLLLPSARLLGWALEGFVLFLRHCSEVFPLRKIYAETFGFNVGQFGSGSFSFLVEEARLRHHEYHDGRFWDKIVVAIYRSEVEHRRSDEQRRQANAG